MSVLRLRGGWGETSCTSSRTAQNLVCPFHRQVPRRQVPQLIAFASSQQAAQSGHSLCLCCVCAGARRGKLQDGTKSGCPPEVVEATARAEVICSSCDLPRSAPISVSVAFARGLGRDELHKLQEGAKSGLSFSPPGAAAASAPADRLRFSPANCTERTLALSVLRLRGGWGETSCTSSRTAQNLVCPFHRQVPRRQVPQLDRLRFSPANCTERTLALSSVAFARGLGRDELHKSRTAQNLVCPFHRQRCREGKCPS